MVLFSYHRVDVGFTPVSMGRSVSRRICTTLDGFDGWIRGVSLRSEREHASSVTESPHFGSGDESLFFVESLDMSAMCEIYAEREAISILWSLDS